MKCILITWEVCQIWQAVVLKNSSSSKKWARKMVGTRAFRLIYSRYPNLRSQVIPVLSSLRSATSKILERSSRTLLASLNMQVNNLLEVSNMGLGTRRDSKGSSLGIRRALTGPNMEISRDSMGSNSVVNHLTVKWLDSEASKALKGSNHSVLCLKPGLEVRINRRSPLQISQKGWWEVRNKAFDRSRGSRGGLARVGQAAR